MTRTNMKKFIGSMKRSSVVGGSKSNDNQSRVPAQQQPSLPQGDHPEAVVVREAVAFCEAGSPGAAGAGDEYLHLPAIVDAAESSPYAAKEVALTLQRYLSKQNFERGYAQYNAIMLTRILTDNPGRGFTQNFDKTFVSTIKTLLRECRDSSVQQITRETLDYFEVEKLNANDTLMPLIEMWRKEKGGSARMYSSSVGIPETVTASHDYNHNTHNYQGHIHNGAAPHVPRESRPPRGLPPPDELAARIEEARTSARLLVQMLQSTPPNELIGNELIKEFAERAKQASRSVQQFMACENPAPDESTMLTLIETSEQLNIAQTKHQRVMLQARKAAGLKGSSPQPQANPQDPFSTTSMQNSLPPQQPPRPVQAQQPYGTPSRYESGGLYNNATPTVNPAEQDHHSYLPPPGPPPTQRQEPQQPGSTNIYQELSHEPVPHHRSNDTYPQSGAARLSPTATRDYNVSENPFADDGDYAAPSHPPAGRQPQPEPPSQPPANSYSLFNRAAGQLRDPEAPAHNTSSLNTFGPSDQEVAANSNAVFLQSDKDNRPGLHGYNSGWQPTRSYMKRQESSEAHITMSGAGP